ncbi:MAG: competence/damage-inducible protein A [Breznakibacter sp.]
MNVEIITIGTELLIGQVVDTNSAWMGTELNLAGFDVTRKTTIPDSGAAIQSAITEALGRVSIVLVTGGLGPTKDDITKQTLCELFGTTLVFDQTVYEDVERLLKGRVTQINGLNRSQAMVPKDCTVIRNPVGTAPIMWFNRQGKVLVAMPGVPSEMQQAMVHEVIPRLKQQFVTGVILHKTILVAQLPESVLAERIALWEEQLKPALSLAYLPSPGKVRLRLTAKGEKEQELAHLIEKAVEELKHIIGQYIFGYDDEQPQEEVGRILALRRQTLSVAESCTGGYIAHLITGVPGSSSYFKGGVVAYSNEVKVGLLGVEPEVLERYGAVSQPVVEQMALGAQRVLQTDYAIATSGIAGPMGGSAEKPVGTVWMAWATPEGVFSKKFQFGTIRGRNILRSGETALILLQQYLNGVLTITD